MAAFRRKRLFGPAWVVLTASRVQQLQSVALTATRAHDSARPGADVRAQQRLRGSLRTSLDVRAAIARPELRGCAFAACEFIAPSHQEPEAVRRSQSLGGTAMAVRSSAICNPRLAEICEHLERLSAAGALTAARALPLFEEGIAEAERAGDVIGVQMGRVLLDELRRDPGALVRLAGAGQRA